MGRFQKKIIFFIIATAIISGVVIFYALQYQASTLIVKMWCDQKSDAQVFFDTGFGFNESASFRFKLNREDHVYRLRVPQKEIKSIRLDPLNRKGLFEIESIGIEKKNIKIREWNSSQLIQNLIPLNQVEVINDGKGTFKGRSFGDDPFLELKNLPTGYNERSFISRLGLALIAIATVLFLGVVYLRLKGTSQFNYDAHPGKLTSRFIQPWDIIGFFFILVCCFFLFQHPDLLHIGGSSFSYLNGYILDFYDANMKALGGGNNYLPSTYILYAIWNIPIRLLGWVKKASMDVGLVLFWYKFLTTLFYFATGFIIYKIGFSLGLKKEDSKLMAILWLTTPIAFFSQFIFGQCDIFTVFFMMLGVYFYLEKKMGAFIAFFAVSITFKYFPIFIFFPLLFLNEKRPLKLLLSTALFILPAALEIMLYQHSPGFQEGILGFEPNQRFLYAGFQVHRIVTLSILVITWIILCGIAYMKEMRDDSEFFRYSIFTALAATTIVFSFTIWHPQWVILMTPFLAITIFLDKNARYFLILDLLLMFFYVASTVTLFPNNVDQTLWHLGIFGNVGQTNGLMMRDIFFLSIWKVQYTGFYLSLFVGCLIIHLFLKRSVDLPVADNSITFPVKNSWNLARLRFFAGILIFLVPAFISLFS